MDFVSETDKKISLYEHIQELKKRILFCIFFVVGCFSISYIYSDSILFFISKPLLKYTNNKMIYTSISEPFFNYIKIAGITSIGISIPFFMLQLYLFIAPGLYKHEKKWIISIGIAFFLMFLFGVCILYYGILPLGIEFLIKFNKSGLFVLDIQAKLSEYVETISELIIGFGFAFEIPIFLIILCRIGIINHLHLKKFRRFAIVIIFIISAIVTPPDILSQIILGSMIIFFYEITILICKIIEKRTRHKKQYLD